MHIIDLEMIVNWFIVWVLIR